MSSSERKKEDWMNHKWRPMMGWLYMIVCAADFVVFPVLYAVYNAVVYPGQLPAGTPGQWQPLTLQGAGLFHIAMGAVLGVTAWGRTQEKLQGAHTGIIQPQSQPDPIPTNTRPFTKVNSVTVGFGGRQAPPPAPQPLI